LKGNFVLRQILFSTPLKGSRIIPCGFQGTGVLLRNVRRVLNRNSVLNYAIEA
jgi:hypothetical protein